MANKALLSNFSGICMFFRFDSCQAKCFPSFPSFPSFAQVLFYFFSRLLAGKKFSADCFAYSLQNYLIYGSVCPPKPLKQWKLAANSRFVGILLGMVKNGGLENGINPWIWLQLWRKVLWRMGRIYCFPCKKTFPPPRCIMQYALCF